jgi:lysophospholipase
MIRLSGVRRPHGAHLLAEVLDAIGFGGAFAPGGGSKSITNMPFAGNTLTSDPVRYARAADVVMASPDLALGWPTVGWVHAAFRLMRRFADPDYPRKANIPVLVIAAGDDEIVDTRAIERFVSRLRAGRLIVVEGARHEVMMERDSLRDQFWAAFDQFIPGVEAARARSA